MKYIDIRGIDSKDVELQSIMKLFKFDMKRFDNIKITELEVPVGDVKWVIGAWKIEGNDIKETRIKGTSIDNVIKKLN